MEWIRDVKIELCRSFVAAQRRNNRIIHPALDAFVTIQVRQPDRVKSKKKYISTHVVYGIDERVVAAVTHREPVETEPYDIDVWIPVEKKK